MRDKKTLVAFWGALRDSHREKSPPLHLTLSTLHQQNRSNLRFYLHLCKKSSNFAGENRSFIDMNKILNYIEELGEGKYQCYKTRKL